MIDPSPPHSQQQLNLSLFSILADRYVEISHHGLNSISLTITDVEHVFMCLLATSVSSLMKCLSIFFVHFLIRLLSFFVLF